MDDPEKTRFFLQKYHILNEYQCKTSFFRIIYFGPKSKVRDDEERKKGRVGLRTGTIQALYSDGTYLSGMLAGVFK